MRLRRLTIRTLPGIEPGFVVEPPGDGVNLVVGRNASGKSSLVRALMYLLAADRRDPAALSLEAEFEDGDSRWQVIRNGSQIAWQRDGAAATRPALPGAAQIDRYRLSVENLLAHNDDTDRQLAGQLRRELLGNCDLDALRAETKGQTGNRFGGSEARVLVESVKAQRQVEADYAALQREEADLPALARRITAAAAAGEQRRQLARARKLADAIEVRKSCAVKLAEFPAEMERLHGDEATRLDALEDKARKLGERLRDEQGKLEAATTELAGTGLAAAAPTAEMLDASDDKLQTLAALATNRQRHRDDAAKAQAALRDAHAQLGGGEAPPRIDADACDRAEKLAANLIAKRKELTELQVQLQTAGEAPDAQRLDHLRDAVQALRDWLAARASSPQAGAPAYGWPLLAAAGAAVAALVAAGLAVYLQATPVAFIAALAALLAAAGAVGFWRDARQGSTESAAAADAERRFGRTGLDAPLRWDEPAAGARLLKVEDEWAGLRAQQERAAGAKRLGADIKACEAKLEQLETGRAALAAEIGFDPETPAVAFHDFILRCRDWDQARKEHAEERALVADFDEQIASAARSVRVFLDGWRGPGGAGDEVAGAAAGDAAGDAPDLDLLRSRFAHLKRRVDAAAEAQRRSDRHETEIASIRRQLQENAEDTEQLLSSAGCDADGRALLDERLERLPAWRAASSALAAAENTEKLARGELASSPNLIARAERGERAQLEAEAAAAARKADEHTRLVEQRQAIATRLEDAGSDLRLEAAAAAAARARQALESKREEALLAEATALLLDDVEQAFKAEHEPDILRRARAIFADVTAHAFDLQLRTDGSFAARDVTQDAERALDELSSGTRMQLLLALRLAWIEAHEQGGETLPLFLDEALTTSDEARFGVMAESLERIANADGRPRQIFYLSARHHEAALWRQATGNEPTVIDLAVVRGAAETTAPATYRVETPPAVPAPDSGENAEAYAGRLGVPHFDPRLSPGAVHLFYVLRDDPPLLHSLLATWRIGAVGQLKELLATPAGRAAVEDDGMRQRLLLRSRAVREWTEQWRVGRGRPVDRGMLEQCDAVSDVFIDRVAGLAEELTGDGAALVEALRAGRLARFHASKADELQQWLADNGYIDDRQRLTEGDRRRLTLQRLAPATAADARDVNRVIDWLESAARWLE